MKIRLGLAGAVVLASLLLGATTEARHPGRPSHGIAGRHYHHRPRPHVFVGGVFWDPFFYPRPYPYYVPYPAYPYAPPPPEEPLASADEPDDEADTAPADPLRASYGLIQLHGVPDGAAVELDGRFWLTAELLDRRWLALPQGEHTLAARVQGGEPIERRVEMAAGKTQVVRFAFPR